MHAIHWFEIPTLDLDRATRFYERLLGVDLRRELFGTTPMAIIPSGERDVGGALVRDEQRAPSAGGALVYLATSDLESVLARARDAAVRVLLDKTDIGAPGFIAVLEDSEGNVVGLHEAR